ncbi:MAG TPA: hypothetical protein VEF71_01620, partial [Streptosporangiaceae bacterium]|nr:hypothetical protein [Streptosporangiaceae bacterium]
MSATTSRTLTGWGRMAPSRAFGDHLAEPGQEADGLRYDPARPAVGTVAALRGRRATVWVPALLGGLVPALRLIPVRHGVVCRPEPGFSQVGSGAVRVLVAEDDERLGEVLARGLREQGYVVDLVPDGETAASYLRFYS